MWKSTYVYIYNIDSLAFSIPCLPSSELFLTVKLWMTWIFLLKFFYSFSSFSVNVYHFYLSYWPAMLCSEKNRSSSNGSTQMEKTLAMIKPDGVLGNYTDRIKNAVLGSGFSIFKETIVQLDEDSATSFYAEHSTKSFYSSLVKYIMRYLIYFYDYCMLFLISFFSFFSKSELSSWNWFLSGLN